MGVIEHLRNVVRFVVRCSVVMLFSVLTMSMIRPPQEESLEYQVKAVFLYNFAQFVEWPPQAFPEGNGPLVIGILGNDPFGNYIDETIKGESVDGHPLVVKRFQTIEEIGVCHILFIGATEKDKVKIICEKLKSRNILTVGDVPNFAKQGGMVRFFIEDKKTKIRINLEATKKADLSISSKLLRLAEIVNY